METPNWVKRAKVGDKIVALTDGETTPLKKGNVYTIRGFGGVQYFGISTKFEPAGYYETVYVQGIRRRFINGVETGISVTIFKPASNRSTDTGMKALKSILNGSDITEHENA